MTKIKTDVIIIGAGAAGLMGAIECAKRGRKTIVLDHAQIIGEKIRISGGGRCNFTNINAKPDNYLSQNPHFCKSALARYTPDDFIKLVQSYNIAYYEKSLGQLFCVDSAKDIVKLLLNECEKFGAEIKLKTEIKHVKKIDDGFVIETSEHVYFCASVIVACGGKSIPKIGATGFGYDLARQFNINVIDTRPALVPLTFTSQAKEALANLAGVALDVVVSAHKGVFREALLFTHRGLSGPAILQISSYWREGEDITINLLPDIDIASTLKEARTMGSKQTLNGFLPLHLPKRLVQYLMDAYHLPQNKNIADLSDKIIEHIATTIHSWTLTPQGSEGYRTAEVTLGGVDTNELSSKTFEAKKIEGLYFIGEVVDVTGHLGGYNFQWAWASGFAAGQFA